ncbi:MAG TPA: tetratricopeptide repeat protein [Spirochaetota bacterium]|nr:tetratricopeptide repeat protein [Spirochaetota bacterium]HOM38395.1 tetratricopeptide repeat protein [Spirochaetota bacterium]HPQ48387.1 tetratricopeptide repeat protein [Spirochaetota bacterium]
MKKILLIIFISFLSFCSTTPVKDNNISNTNKPSFKEEKGDDIDIIVNLIKDKKLSEAKLILDSKLKKDPDNTRYLLLLADIFYQQKDYRSSIDILIKVVDKVEEKPKVLLSIANSYYSIKEYYNALSTYKKVVELDPLLLEAYIKIGDIYTEWGNFKKASEWYNKAIEIDKRSADIYVSMAKMNFEMKLIRKAEDLLKEALYINPMSFEGRKLELSILYEKKDGKNLEKRAKEFLNDFNNPDGLLFLGNFYLETGKVKESFTYFKTALDVYPQYAPSYNGMGNYYYEIDDLKNSEYYYNKALTLNPKYPEVYYNLGLVNVKYKNYDKAISYFKKAYELSKTLSISYLMIAIANYYKGDEKEALNSIIDFYFIDAGLYYQTIKTPKYGPVMGNIVANYWNYYDRNNQFNKGLYLLLVQSLSGAFYIFEKIKDNPNSYFLLSRAYFINNQIEKGKDAFEKYVKVEKPNKEIIILDSSFNPVKGEEWFFKLLFEK